MFQQALNKSLRSNSERVAIEKGEKPVLYSELAAVSNTITQFLLTGNTGAGTVIGIQLSDPAEQIAAVVGVLNARRGFVPLNPKLPAMRLASMMEDLDIQWVIGSKKDGGAPASGVSYYWYEDITRKMADPLQGEERYPEPDGEDAVYIYFTSGSTGRPKGVVGRTAACCNSWSGR